MKKHFFLLFSLCLLLFSCGDNKIPEGEIEYIISYPHSDVSGFMEHILPETMTLTFKGSKVKSQIARGKIFKTEVVSDEADNSIEMRLDFGDKIFYCVLNEEEVKKLKDSQPTYDVTETGKADSVQGMWSKEYTVNSNDTIDHDNAWFTEDLAPQSAYFYSSYHDIKGLPLVFDIERYGIIMHLEATKFIRREVKEEEFNRDPALEEVSFDEYEAEVQELFDILMN
ncbi:MAG: hypothetical protein MI810_13375 [Flavobacteriales bacterium]|nr:hypothetical protein [Flavobacteriales bacterium]